MTVPLDFTNAQCHILLFEVTLLSQFFFAADLKSHLKAFLWVWFTCTFLTEVLKTFCHRLYFSELLNFASLNKKKRIFFILFKNLFHLFIFLAIVAVSSALVAFAVVGAGICYHR